MHLGISRVLFLISTVANFIYWLDITVGMLCEKICCMRSSSSPLRRTYRDDLCSKRSFRYDSPLGESLNDRKEILSTGKTRNDRVF